MSIPIYDETASIACTATAPEIASRVAQLESMRAAMASVERTSDGLLVHFNATQNEDDLRQFAKDEKGCCNFWGFEVQGGTGGPTLRWDGPPAVGDFLDRLHAWFLTDEPLTLDSGLL